MRPVVTLVSLAVDCVLKDKIRPELKLRTMACSQTIPQKSDFDFKDE
jgi:hypothetical protein